MGSEARLEIVDATEKSLCSILFSGGILPDAMKENLSILRIDGLDVEVRRRAVRSMRIAILSPGGKIVLTAPFGSSDTVILAALVKRLGWIREHRARMATVKVPPRLEYVDGEALGFFGKSYAIRFVEGTGKRGLRLRAR